MWRTIFFIFNIFILILFRRQDFLLNYWLIHVLTLAFKININKFFLPSYFSRSGTLAWDVFIFQNNNQNIMAYHDKSIYLDVLGWHNKLWYFLWFDNLENKVIKLFDKYGFTRRLWHIKYSGKYFFIPWQCSPVTIPLHYRDRPVTSPRP